MWCSENKLKLKFLHELAYTVRTNLCARWYNYIQIKYLYWFRKSFWTSVSFTNHIRPMLSQAIKMYIYLIRNYRNLTNIIAIKLLYITYVRSEFTMIWNPLHLSHSFEWKQPTQVSEIFILQGGAHSIQSILYRHLIERHNVLYLNARTQIASIAVLWILLLSKINCSDLVQQLNFRALRLNIRSNVVCHCKRV